MEEATSCPYWNRHSLWIDWPSLHTMLQPELPCLNLKHALSTVMAPHSTASNEGTHLTIKVYGHGPVPVEFTGLTMFPTILRQLA